MKCSGVYGNKYMLLTDFRAVDGREVWRYRASGPARRKELPFNVCRLDEETSIKDNLNFHGRWRQFLCFRCLSYRRQDVSISKIIILIIIPIY